MNYCRNPKTTNINDRVRNSTWCYHEFKPSNYDKAYCSIPMCNEPSVGTYPECLNDESGAGYRGKLDHTGSNKTCLLWTQFVDLGIHKDLDFPDQNVDFALNYCRNPGRVRSGLWCYVHTGDYIYNGDFFIQKRKLFSIEEVQE